MPVAVRVEARNHAQMEQKTSVIRGMRKAKERTAMAVSV